MVLLSSYLWGLQPVETTKISSKGQVVVPRSSFKETNISEVASGLKFRGKPKTLSDMDSAIGKGVKNQHKLFSARADKLGSCLVELA